MLSLAHIGLYALFVAHSSDAYFTLSHPTAFVSRSNSQKTAPCGDAPLIFETSTEYYVGGDAVAVLTAEEHANILIRATVGPLAVANWTNLFPVVAQSHSGAFCEPLVPAPEDWVGKDGVIQVIQNGEDGLSYQVSYGVFRVQRESALYVSYPVADFFFFRFHSAHQSAFAGREPHPSRPSVVMGRM